MGSKVLVRQITALFLIGVSWVTFRREPLLLRLSQLNLVLIVFLRVILYIADEVEDLIFVEECQFDLIVIIHDVSVHNELLRDIFVFLIGVNLEVEIILILHKVLLVVHLIVIRGEAL